VRECLSLSSPISKRRLRGDHGYTASRFERAYQRRLLVDGGVPHLTRIVLVDDVCTEGSTIRASAAALHAVNPTLEIVAATAGQMTVRAAVRCERHLIA